MMTAKKRLTNIEPKPLDLIPKGNLKTVKEIIKESVKKVKTVKKSLKPYYDDSLNFFEFMLVVGKSIEMYFWQRSGIPEESEIKQKDNFLMTLILKIMKFILGRMGIKL